MADEQTENQSGQGVASPPATARSNPDFARHWTSWLPWPGKGSSLTVNTLTPPTSGWSRICPYFRICRLTIRPEFWRRPAGDESGGRSQFCRTCGHQAWPGVAVRLNSGGLGFFSQLGVVRRPDLTQYYVDGFTPNRDALSSAKRIRRSSPKFSTASCAG